MDDAYTFCEALVRAADKDRYLASLFAPAAARQHLHALYAFASEIARVRDAAREPLPGEIRLQWWRDALQGEGRGQVSANPLAAALLDTIARSALPMDRLMALIDAHAFDLYDDAMRSIPPGRCLRWRRKFSAAPIAPVRSPRQRRKRESPMARHNACAPFRAILPADNCSCRSTCWRSTVSLARKSTRIKTRPACAMRWRRCAIMRARPSAGLAWPRPTSRNPARRHF